MPDRTLANTPPLAQGTPYDEWRREDLRKQAEAARLGLPAPALKIAGKRDDYGIKSFGGDPGKKRKRELFGQEAAS